MRLPPHVVATALALHEQRERITRGIPPRKNLLDQEDLNLGSSQRLVPSNRIAVVQPCLPARLLDLQGSSQLGRIVTITLFQTYIEAALSQSVFPNGPITGIVEFGNGAAVSRVEFDVPFISSTPDLLNPFDPNNDPLNGFRSAPAGAVTLTVPGSSVRVFARNDSTFPFAGAPTQPIGGSLGFPLPIADPTVYAHANYDQTFGSARNLQKTVAVIHFTVPLTPGSSIAIGIPAFARSVRFPRRPRTEPLLVARGTSTSVEGGSELIAANSEGPVELNGWGTHFLLLTNNGANDITGLTAVFELVI